MEKYYYKMKKSGAVLGLILSLGLIFFAGAIIILSHGHEFTLIMSVFLVPIGVWGVLRFLFKSYKRKVKRVMKKNNLSPDEVAMDLDMSAFEYQRFEKDMAIGQKYALCLNADPNLIIYDQLVWIRVESSEEKVAGVSITTFYVVFANNKKKQYYAPIEGGEQMAWDIAEVLRELAPWCYYGDASAIHHMFSTDFKTMVEIVEQKKINLSQKSYSPL